MKRGTINDKHVLFANDAAGIRLAEQPERASFYGDVQPADLDELARAKLEAVDAMALENILQLNSIDDNDDDEELLAETGQGQGQGQGQSVHVYYIRQIINHGS